MSRWKEAGICIVLVALVWVAMARNKSDKPEENKVPVNLQTEENNHVWMGFDALPFGEAFNMMYRKHGKGHVFDWRDKAYLTKYKEEK